MRLLLDQNLSPRLVPALGDLYPGSTHVREGTALRRRSWPFSVTITPRCLCSRATRRARSWRSGSGRFGGVGRAGSRRELSIAGPLDFPILRSDPRWALLSGAVVLWDSSLSGDALKSTWLQRRLAYSGVSRVPRTTYWVPPTPLASVRNSCGVSTLETANRARDFKLQPAALKTRQLMDVDPGHYGTSYGLRCRPAS